jgi:hypothetical protein
VGWSLQTRSGLDGSPMLRFLNHVLPRLEEHPDVDIEVLGTPIPYAEADEAPTVSLAITESSDSTDWFDLDVQVRVGPGRVIAAWYSLTLGEARDPAQRHVVPGRRPQATELRGSSQARAPSGAPGPLRLSAYQADLWTELEEPGVKGAGAAVARGGCGCGRGLPEPMPPQAGGRLRHYQHSGYGG